MLTIVSDFNVFRVHKRSMKHLLPVAMIPEAVYMKHVLAVELLACLADEVVTVSLMERALRCFYTGVRKSEAIVASLPNLSTTTFTIESNGANYGGFTKETLARHFTLIADYIAEYPERNSIDLSHCKGILPLIERFFSLARVSRADTGREGLDDMLYALQTLNPVTDLYYAMLDYDKYSIEQVVAMCRGITEKERRELRTLRRVRSQVPLTVDTSEPECVPEEGEGLYVLFLMVQAIPFIAAHGRVLWPSQKSIVFLYETLQACKDHPLLDPSLIDEDYIEDTPYISWRDAELVTLGLILALKSSNEHQTRRILTMLGIQHLTIGNETLVAIPPFQLTIDPRDIDRHQKESLCEIMREREWSFAPVELITELTEAIVHEITIDELSDSER